MLIDKTMQVASWYACWRWWYSLQSLHCAVARQSYSFVCARLTKAKPRSAAYGISHGQLASVASCGGYCVGHDLRCLIRCGRGSRSCRHGHDGRRSSTDRGWMEHALHGTGTVQQPASERAARSRRRASGHAASHCECLCGGAAMPLAAADQATNVRSPQCLTTALN